MNGVHDLGGMHGYGPIDPPDEEPLFKEDWERRVFGLFAPVQIAAQVSVDEFRFAIEEMGAANYLETSYYEHWLHAFETLVVQRGLMSAEELAAGASQSGSGGDPPLAAEAVPKIVATGHRARSDLPSPRYAVGDRVRARNLHPAHHTRLPRYVRGKVGVIAALNGGYELPDQIAQRVEAPPQGCYSVRFEGRELWGDDAPQNDALYIDLFDDYLDPA